VLISHFKFKSVEVNGTNISVLINFARFCCKVQ
jgi:ligand-binding sensor protein